MVVGKLLMVTLCMMSAACLALSPSPPELPPVTQLQPQPELPDPLTAFDGHRITTKDQWSVERRPELKRLFQHYMYGYLPEPQPVTATLEREDKNYYGGKATKKELTLRFGPSETPPIHLLLILPNQRKKPAAVFLAMNFHGNFAVVHDPALPLPQGWMYPNAVGAKNNRATEAGRGSQAEAWAVEQTIDRGYALATFWNGDIDPDQPHQRQGIQPHFEKQGLVQPGPHAWGTIAAWAYGLHRAVDYLVTDKEIDAHRIAVVGHSRLGKTALLAAAFDDRIALAIPHQAGCGGTAPSRGKIGESVQRINTSFPHWFNGTFKEFNGKPELLPFDQHCLVALMAPRPVLFTNAVEDTWANPAGQFAVLQAADPVYHFLGVPGLGVEKMPEPGRLVGERLGYFIRPGTHAMPREDWRVFLDFADRHLGKGAD
jgi:hypothetical protein